MSDTSPRDQQRPSPDALLDAARREGRGRLKIFLGAAPGVGKTFEMLQSGRARLASGADVVIGVVETHGRRETEALLAGFEIVPRRLVDHKGQALDEMDLDAILKRRPELVLVDELAHTNAPDSRHPKRYMDVEELLTAGIDVYTTLNIQHVESLNDVVAQITKIRVRETVPDSILDGADDIEVVDLSPGELIDRLKEGKVYVPHTAKRAIENFFQPGNLTALRELALRRTAQRVDAQLLTHMQSHAIAGPWAAGDRVLVCISEDPRAPALVRYAKRLADRLHAPFAALYVETQRSLQLSEVQRDRIAEALRLAEHLGGQSATIPGGDRRIADEVLAYARTENVNHIVIGKSERSRLFEIVNGSVVHELVRRAGAISVHVIAGEALPVEAAAKARTAPPRSPVEPWPYGVALVAVAAALGLSKLIQPFVGIENVDLVFLLAIIAVASRFGLLPALTAMAASSICYNFFFLPPLYTFTIAEPTNVAALVIFTLVTFLVSNLAARVRAQAITARSRARTTEQLYSFSRKLAGVGTIDDLLWATSFQIASMLKVRVVLLLSQNGLFEVRAGYPPEDLVGDADIGAAKWAFENNEPAGRGADTLPGAKWLFLPMRTGRGAIGVIGISKDDRTGPLLAPEERRLLDALSDQAALAIERVFLVEDIDRARRAAETDKLRQALLTSISHDLKTPLASIMGAAGTLRELSAELDEAGKAELLTSILDESERLNRFIANLLDMTRLESGAVEANLAMIDVGEIVGSVLRRAAKMLEGRAIDVRLPPDLPLIRLDPVLFEQAVFNVVDNAVKYSPAGSAVRIEARRRGDSLLLQIVDEGPGLPGDDMEHVFDKFYRVRMQDNVRAGTGLGLSIARGFIEAMGGTITASNRTDRSGAIFTIAMPIPEDGVRLDPTE